MKGDTFKKAVEGGEREKNPSTKTKALNAEVGKEGEAVILECACVQGPQWARTLDRRAKNGNQGPSKAKASRRWAKKGE